MSYRPLILASTALALAAPAAASVSDFRLPGSGETPSVQGPVVEGVPRPRATPTPAPTAAPAPSPTPSPTATAAAPTPSPTPSTTATPRTAPTASAPSSRAAAQPTRASPSPTPSATEPIAAEPQPDPPATQAAPSATPSLPASTLPSATAETPEESSSWWLWIAGGLTALLAVAVGAFLLGRRSSGGGAATVAVPQIARPRVAAEPHPEQRSGEQPSAEPAEPASAATSQSAPAAPPAAAAFAQQGPLQIALQPQRLSLTLMAATLSYRLALANQGSEALRGIEIGADLVSAHASLPRDQLLAGPHSRLEPRHRIEELAPGDTVELSGDLRLPYPQILPIQQGQAVIFVPLARFVARSGSEAAAVTAVVGQVSPAGGLLPVRLDLGPRIYNGLVGRSF